MALVGDAVSTGRYDGTETRMTVLVPLCPADWVEGALSWLLVEYSEATRQPIRG